MNNKDWLIIRSRTLPVSCRIHKPVVMMVFWLGAIAFAAMVINLTIGDYPISLLNVLKTLLGLERDNLDYHFAIEQLRLPRTLVALMVGLALGIAGAILQGLTRNPLADPGIIGINAGASLAAVTMIVLLPSVGSVFLPLSAFVGALIVAILIYWLAWNRGSSPNRFILVGVGMAAIATALTTFMITFGDITNVSQALVWLAGSVYGRTWEQVWSLLPWIIVFVPLALILTKHLNRLNLGDDLARGLGSAVEWERALLLLVSVALAGSAVATAGTIGFVGLIAPHLARQLVGATQEAIMPVAGMMGGAIVVLADLLGRTLFAPIEIPCGVVTAAIGAPYFLYLLICNRK